MTWVALRVAAGAAVGDKSPRLKSGDKSPQSKTLRDFQGRYKVRRFLGCADIF